MPARVYPVILSGGSGTRLWPLSRDLLPKQLLSLIGEMSLLAATANRVSGEGFAPPIVICNEDHRFMVAEQLAAAGIAPEAIIIEPVGRNTAPAIAAAAALLTERDPEAMMLVLPSDHLIGDEPAFLFAIGIAVKAAGARRLVTFGITPTAPETGYGYIRRGPALGDCAGAFEIDRFVEKPDLRTALEYLADGGWSWNSGMFVFPVALLLEELGRLEPEMVAGAVESVRCAQTNAEAVQLAVEAFGAIEGKSIDYALMEHTPHAAVVPASLGWSDIGSWQALWDIGAKDGASNVTVGDVMVEDTHGSYLRSHGPLIAGLGLKDVIVVATRDVVLAAAKDRAQDVKLFVNRLRATERTEARSPAVVHRPWGTLQTVDSGPFYQVKRITVKPGFRRALQTHARRTEHWVVVNGVARVTRGDEILVLSANMSVDIPLGAVHRLENPGPDPLELIEVQSGDYLGEDDIVRLADDWGRK